MSATELLSQPDYEYPAYSPSILVIEDKASESDILKQKLKNGNCQVTQSNLSTDSLNLAYHKYFDLIVLNLSRPKLADLVETWEKLKNDPQLAEIPLAIIAPLHQAKSILEDLEKPTPVYYLPKDSRVDIRLLRIINQMQYMRYRYN